ncbi:MAG TPA: ANTAR domain-containing protein [Bryobacteraceae bacterium]|nr:ANTAR domain-containing protein [Bryobacteraceae bacterium]
MGGGAVGERSKVCDKDVLETSLEGLKRAWAELRCAALMVLAAEDSFVEVVFPAASPLVLTPEQRQALMGRSGPIEAGDPIARLLAPAAKGRANSFLIFPWRGPGRTITIAFGFAESKPPFASLPSHVLESLNLAALAAWSAKEIARLRAELRSVNGQFAGRKMVERAKGILQSQHGMNEQQAYEYLRRMSRQRRVAMSKLAQDLVGAAHSSPAIR